VTVTYGGWTSVPEANENELVGVEDGDPARTIAARPRPASPDEAVGRLEREIALWRSPKMREVAEIIRRAAGVDVTVLVCGETGTGKDLVARTIHHLSSRRGAPLVKVNCAAMPRDLLESELFGHERGAFTGAHQRKIGKFEAADGGTMLLDEIGDLHPALQAKLLHVLQDGEFSRVGGKSTIKVDVRVIAATNQDLDRAVAAGRFREDLYYRINVIQIVVPPLRERREEIPALVNYLIGRHSRLFHREEFTVPPEVMDALVKRSYPGNVREVENLVKRMIVLGNPSLLQAETPLWKADGSADAAPRRNPALIPALKDVAREAARAAEREAINRVLEETRWNRAKAAKLLQISYRALLYKIRDVGLDRRYPEAPSKT
jgi:two-component system response regulator AtoC